MPGDKNAQVPPGILIIGGGRREKNNSEVAAMFPGETY